jgi:hypothetical protein
MMDEPNEPLDAEACVRRIHRGRWATAAFATGAERRKRKHIPLFLVLIPKGNRSRTYLHGRRNGLCNVRDCLIFFLNIWRPGAGKTGFGILNRMASCRIAKCSVS